MIKAFDLMKLAAENPEQYSGKKYKVISGSRLHNSVGENKFHSSCVIINGTLTSDDRNKFYLSIFSDTELEEIQQPIPFMEAINCGKRIKPCVHTYSNHDRFETVQDWLECKSLILAEVNGLWEVEG